MHRSTLALSLFFLIIQGSSQLKSQTQILCDRNFQLFFLEGKKKATNIDCIINESGYGYKKIKRLMDLSGLAMNFTVCRRNGIKNAYAETDSNGIRKIVYDEEFLKKLDKDTGSFESSLILAHEIGHHLAAHFISLNTQGSTGIDQLDSLKRMKELEADRFAGFLAFRWGATLVNIQKSYKKLNKNKNTSGTTHPDIEKRIEALTLGFELGKNQIKQSSIDIEALKTQETDFDLGGKEKIERNKLLNSIVGVVFEAGQHIDKTSDYSIRAFLTLRDGDFGFNTEWYKALKKFYLGNTTYFPVDRKNEYLAIYQLNAYVDEDKRLTPQVYLAIYIKEDTMQIIPLTGTSSGQVIYMSRFDSKSIQLSQIKSIFIEYIKVMIEDESKRIRSSATE